jgi:inositol transport system substrate-binding protein
VTITGKGRIAMTTKAHKTRKIFLLLTELPGKTSQAIRLCTGYDYTHASIGLEEDMNTFYSFVMKGFIVEKLTRYVKPERVPFPCAMYELKVTEDVYRNIKALLERCVAYQGALRYTILGVILCLLHIPHRREGRFFCSHFMAEILNRSSAAHLHKDSALYLPRDLKNLPGMNQVFRGNLRGLLEQYAIAPLPAAA